MRFGSPGADQRHAGRVAAFADRADTGSVRRHVRRGSRRRAAARTGLGLALLVVTAAALAAAPKAVVDCRSTGTSLEYDCTIELKRDGVPIEGARMSLTADMPSMPMAHNVAPVQAEPGDAPGRYRARLQLEMTGEWALKLRLSEPMRDLVIVNRHFDENGTVAATEGAGHDHGAHGGSMGRMPRPRQ